MGHSQADKARSRQRILDMAAAQIRERGLAGVSIAELMKSANLTHGGFYGHFASRDDLIAEALEKALTEGEASAIRSGSQKGPRTLKSFLNNYLSKTHRDSPGFGCAVSALAGDVARAGPRTREIMSRHVRHYFENVQNLIDDGEESELAIATMCTVIGALTLSRVMRDEDMSDRVLQAARKTILDQAKSREEP